MLSRWICQDMSRMDAGCIHPRLITVISAAQVQRIIDHYFLIIRSISNSELLKLYSTINGSITND